MSAPLAGKFQDHYAVLGVEPNADSETIQRAYSKLAQKYNPKTSATGDAGTFEAVNAAYETLADPELRAVFDKLKGTGRGDSGPAFSGPPFFEALGREAIRRLAILCVLYDRRLTHPTAPSLSMRHLEVIVEATAAELSSAMWYLKQRGYVASDDKSSLQITVDGMDFLESSKPSAADVMPFIRQAPKTESEGADKQGTDKRQTESVLKTLNRALARSAEKPAEVVR
jgi:curved DNA-binding protein CbpA